MLRTLCLLGAFALPLAGCGQAPLVPPPLGFETVLTGAAPTPELERALPLLPGGVRPEEARLKSEPGGPLLILAGGSGRLVLDWPEGRADQPQRLSLRVSGAAGMALRAGLVAGGKPLEIVGPVRAASSRSQDLTLVLPPGQACDELWVAWAEAPVGAQLQGVRVRGVSASERVPEVLAWYASGREQREALGLVAWSDLLVGAGREPGDDGPVRLALARPAGAPEAAAEVWRGERLLRTLEPAQGAGWSEFVIDGEGPLRLRLRGAAGDALAVAVPQRVRSAKSPRRVLLVTSDTHRGDHVGAASGAAAVRTPTLDALAARGIAFQDAWVTTHITNPSHVALLTATHPRDTGIVDNLTPLAGEAPTLAEAFRAAGFRTLAAVSASHLMPARSGLGQGFERFAGPRVGEGQSFDAVTHALGWLDELEGQDVFLWVHVFDAHAPYVPAAAAVERHWPADRDPRDPALTPLHNAPPWAQGVRDLGYLAALYRAEVDELDARLAPLLEHAFWDDGWIAFTADHGETLGVQDGEFDHRRLDPDNLRVPLILAGPRVPSGSEVDRGVETLNLGRTLLDLAELEEQSFPGRNLLDREQQGQARYALARHGGAAALVQGSWLLVLQLADPAETPGARAQRRHQVMLFDLEADVACTQDLVERDRDRAAALRRRLVAWLEDGRQLGWGVATGPADPQEAAELRALGYATSGGGFAGYEQDCDCTDCLLWAR